MLQAIISTNALISEPFATIFNNISEKNPDLVKNELNLAHLRSEIDKNIENILAFYSYYFMDNEKKDIRDINYKILYEVRKSISENINKHIKWYSKLDDTKFFVYNSNITTFAAYPYSGIIRVMKFEDDDKTDYDKIEVSCNLAAMYLNSYLNQNPEILEEYDQYYGDNETPMVLYVGIIDIAIIGLPFRSMNIKI